MIHAAACRESTLTEAKRLQVVHANVHVSPMYKFKRGEEAGVERLGVASPTTAVS